MAPTTGTRRGTQGSGQRRQQNRSTRTAPKKSGSSAKATSSAAKATSNTAAKSTSSTKKTSGTSTGTSTTTRQTSKTRADNGTTISVPYVTAQFHTADVHVPGVGAMPSLSAIGSGLPSLPSRKDLTSAAHTARDYLPSRERALFYGGLAAGTAFSLIQWPVAVAIGLATEVVTREQQDQTTSD